MKYASIIGLFLGQMCQYGLLGCLIVRFRWPCLWPLAIGWDLAVCRRLRSDPTLAMCKQDHSVPFSQSLVIFIWICHTAAFSARLAWGGSPNRAAACVMHLLPVLPVLLVWTLFEQSLELPFDSLIWFTHTDEMYCSLALSVDSLRISPQGQL